MSVDTFSGIALDVWVNVDGDCPMTYEVSRSEVQLELGHSTVTLHLILTDQGLAAFAAATGKALAELRAGDGPDQLGC